MLQKHHPRDSIREVSKLPLRTLWPQEYQKEKEKYTSFHLRVLYVFLYTIHASYYCVHVIIQGYIGNCYQGNMDSNKQQPGEKHHQEDNAFPQVIFSFPLLQPVQLLTYQILHLYNLTSFAYLEIRVFNSPAKRKNSH